MPSLGEIILAALGGGLQGWARGYEARKARELQQQELDLRKRQLQPKQAERFTPSPEFVAAAREIRAGFDPNMPLHDQLAGLLAGLEDRFHGTKEMDSLIKNYEAVIGAYPKTKDPRLHSVAPEHLLVTEEGEEVARGLPKTFAPRAGQEFTFEEKVRQLSSALSRRYGLESGIFKPERGAQYDIALTTAINLVRQGEEIERAINAGIMAAEQGIIIEKKGDKTTYRRAVVPQQRGLSGGAEDYLKKHGFQE